jgi:two-component system, chemotaxis family, chemotaxis protein CheV
MACSKAATRIQAMNSVQKEIDERTNLTQSNRFEMLVFTLGSKAGGEAGERFGINVFKVREILAMPAITTIAGAPEHVLGVVNLRGQVITVIDLVGAVGGDPATQRGILLVTEYARSTQAFAVESVEDIVRLDWSQILPADDTIGRGYVTSIAHLQSEDGRSRMVQILDVESILARVLKTHAQEVSIDSVGPQIRLAPGCVVLAADDSYVARSMLEQELRALGLPFVMANNGEEAWRTLKDLARQCALDGTALRDRVAVVLTDLEMPVMDGFMLTRSIKADPAMRDVPVVIHSSLSGDANENHVRQAGADAYVAKFQARELADVIRKVLSRAQAST